jgi:hypothetical protein
MHVPAGIPGIYGFRDVEPRTRPSFASRELLVVTDQFARVRRFCARALLETIDNRRFYIVAERTGSWMSITEGKPVCLARPILHVVPVPKRLVWNEGVMMDLGDRAAWKFCLVQIIHDRRDGSIRSFARAGESPVAIAVLLGNRQ